MLLARNGLLADDANAALRIALGHGQTRVRPSDIPCQDHMIVCPLVRGTHGPIFFFLLGDAWNHSRWPKLYPFRQRLGIGLPNLLPFFLANG